MNQIAHAHAKVNLFLNVSAKRPDGFHDIASVFEPISLADTITVKPAPSFRLTVENQAPGITTEELLTGNLLEKVARHFIDGSARVPPLHVHLVKRIPAGAGLGGGSTDAAALIALINDMFGLAMPLADQMELGARFGSDVPFFLKGGLAKVTGRGEVVERLGPALPLHLVLIWPGVSVSTPLAYRECVSPAPDSRFEAFVQAAGAMANGKRPLDPEALFAVAAVNDFQKGVGEKFPQVAEALKALASHTPQVLMSGSGSTVFGVFADANAARRARESLTTQWPWTQMVTGMDRGFRLEGLPSKAA